MTSPLRRAFLLEFNTDVYRIDSVDTGLFETLLGYLLREWQMIVQTPVLFGAALVCGCFIGFLAARFVFSAQLNGKNATIESLNSRIFGLKEELNRLKSSNEYVTKRRVGKKLARLELVITVDDQPSEE